MYYKIGAGLKPPGVSTSKHEKMSESKATHGIGGSEQRRHECRLLVLDLGIPAPKNVIAISAKGENRQSIDSGFAGIVWIGGFDHRMNGEMIILPPHKRVSSKL